MKGRLHRKATSAATPNPQSNPIVSGAIPCARQTKVEKRNRRRVRLDQAAGENQDQEAAGFEQLEGGLQPRRRRPSRGIDGRPDQASAPSRPKP